MVLKPSTFLFLLSPWLLLSVQSCDQIFDECPPDQVRKISYWETLHFNLCILQTCDEKLGCVPKVQCEDAIFGCEEPVTEPATEKPEEPDCYSINDIDSDIFTPDTRSVIIRLETIS